MHAPPSSNPSQRLQWNNLIGSEVVHIVGTLIEDIVEKPKTQVQQVYCKFNFIPAFKLVYTGLYIYIGTTLFGGLK